MAENKNETLYFSGKLFKESLLVLEEYFNISSLFISGFRTIVILPDGTLKDFHPTIMDEIKDNTSLCILVSNKDEFLDLYEKKGLSDLIYCSPLLLINHILIQDKTIRAKNIEYSENEFYQELMDDLIYAEQIRPEMLELYNFVNDWKKLPQDKPMTLKCGRKTIKLYNTQNWIFNAINYYLNDHLRIGSVAQAKEELKSFNTKNTGRKVLNKHQTLILHGIDNIYRKATGSDVITNKQCEFIRDYLKYLEIPISTDDFDHSDHLKNIRSKIRNLRKNGCTEKWMESVEDSMNRSINYGW